MASRYYIVAKAPNAVIHGYPAGAWTDSLYAQAYHSPVGWHYELSTSKTNGGAVDRNNTIFSNQHAAHSLYQSLWTPRLAAQTVSGTLNWCWHVYRNWQNASGAVNLAAAWVKVHAYITVGDTPAVRHVLLNNHVEPVAVPYTFGTLGATSASTPIALTSGAALAGDRIRIELGLYAEMPTPDPTQVPTEYMEALWLIPGATGADLTPGMSDGFFTQRSPWIEFSATLTEATAVAAPANGTCATAIVIPALPYHSAGVDCSQATGPARETWWMWTATFSGELVAHVFGSNFFAIMDVRTDNGSAGAACPGSFVPGADINYADSHAAHRGTSNAIFIVTAGWRYWFRVYNKTTPQNIALGGGIARFGLFARAATPQQDDLYLPQGNILQIRDGQMVSVSPTFNNFAPSGVAIDYTETPMNDLNGGTHAGERLLVALFQTGLVEVLDLPTLSWTLDVPTEIDYIQLPTPTTPLYGWGPSQIHVRTDGRLYVGTFGTGFEHVSSTGEPGSQPAFLTTVSDDPDNSDVLQYPVGVGSDANAPLPTPTRFSPTAVLTSPWVIAVDEVHNILYYVDGSLYYPVGGQTVKRWNLTTDTPLPNFVTLAVPAGATKTPGVRGLTLLPDDSLLICNGTDVVHVAANGATIGTFTASVNLDSQALIDVKMQADGEIFWTVDLWTGRLYKVDLATMTELATYETWQIPGSLTQMAIYQPGGITPPPASPACVVDFPVGSDA